MRTAHSVISSGNIDVRIGRGFTAAAVLLGLAAIGVYLAVALVRLTANAKVLPVSVWLPIGHGPSCAAVVRTLES